MLQSNYFMVAWRNFKRSVILASQSPRRKHILSLMGFSFEVATPAVSNEEEYLNAKRIKESLQCLAVAKARTVALQHPDALVLGADTVVVKNNRILGKPKSESDAFEMLRLLSGSTHEVITSVALLCDGQQYRQSTIAKTNVFFRTISENEIEDYVRLGEYRDKAGAYAIQGNAMIFVDRIEGCFYNVVGLPVTAKINLFRNFTVRKDNGDV